MSTQESKNKEWRNPKESNQTLFIGGNPNGNVDDMHTTIQKIDHLRSKESLLWRNGRSVKIDDIVIKARSPYSLSDHRIEYSVVFPAFLCAYKAKDIVHPEDMSTQLRELCICKLSHFLGG